MTRAEDLVKQATAAGLKPATPFFVTPGSEQIRATLDRDATLTTFEDAGGIVLANACGEYSSIFHVNHIIPSRRQVHLCTIVEIVCRSIMHVSLDTHIVKSQSLWSFVVNVFRLLGYVLNIHDLIHILTENAGPCIGMWKRSDNVQKGDSNAIFTSYNRNFKGRNDGNPDTMNFLASPEIVTAMSYAGSTAFNPLTDSLTTPSGEVFRFSPPVGQELPQTGFEDGNPEFLPISGPPAPETEVVVSPTSTRLALLDPFEPFPNTELSNLKVLYKVKGKCTTDTISAAGPWLKYKGHLPNISANTLITATNARTDEVNVAYDVDGTTSGIPELAQKWKDQGVEWLVVAEDNYGEGSAREHAALQPRYLGGRIILTKSFARIHETNLKKQGVVPLTFANGEDYYKIDACDEVTTVGLQDVLKSGGKGQVTLKVKKAGTGEQIEIPTKHTLSEDQCKFILAGSALNLLAKAAAARA